MSEQPRPGEQDGNPAKAWNLERIQGVWKRRRWLAITLFALPFAAMASAIASLPNLYRSTATVLVERQQVPSDIVRSTVTSELETRLHTISQKALSRAKLEGLIARFNLYPKDAGVSDPTEADVERMRRDIRLDTRATGRQSATVAFAVSYRGRDPEVVALVTNTLASFYVEENTKEREGQATVTTEFLREELRTTKIRLDEQERRVSEFKRRHLGELPQQMQGNLATLEGLTAQLRINNDNQVRTTERREDVETQLAETQAVGLSQSAPGSSSTPAPDPAVAHLARLKQDLSAARARYTDAHPTVGRLQEEIVVVERDLAAKPLPELKPDVPPAPTAPASPYVVRLRQALRTADAELKILKADEHRIRASIAAYQTRVDNTPRREQEFQDIARDYDTTKELYHSLSKSSEAAQIAGNMEQRQKGEQFRILDRALPSTVTVAPNRLRLVLAVLVLSLGLAVGVVVLLEMFDTSFHSSDELRAYSDVPVLVGIPLIGTEADQGRRQFRFRAAAAAGVLGLVLVIGASYFVAHGNEQLVRMLDGDRPS